MQWILQTVLYSIGLPLELLVIIAMVRSRAMKEFPFVFAYSVALFAASLIEVPAYIAHFAGLHRARPRAVYYWINEGVLQILIFLAVISLLYHATSSMTNRVLIRRALVAGAVLFAPLSFALHYDPSVRLTQWMTLVSRDLNLCAAILDLALWMILIAIRRDQQRLLLISGGLGIQFSGDAIGHSLRQMSRSTSLLGSVVVVLANLACLYVWWQTFRTAPAKVPAAEPLAKRAEPLRNTGPLLPPHR